MAYVGATPWCRAEMWFDVLMGSFSVRFEGSGRVW